MLRPYKVANQRAISSVGRALPLHGRCRRFESVIAHQPLLAKRARLPRRSQRAKAGLHPRATARQAEGLRVVYVYILQSLDHPDRFYVGITSDLRARLEKHNAGEVPHTSKYAPWSLKTYVAFSDEKQAFAFEKYLKSASGRAFARKRL